MGNSAATSSNFQIHAPSPESETSCTQPNMRLKPMRERIRYGVCNIKISPLANGQRRPSDRGSNFIASPKGAIIHGTQCNPQIIQRALASSGYPVLSPMEISLSDSRAHKLLVVYSNGWQAIPSPETFSRHSGTCVVLGDRTHVNPPYKVKLGDCFRLGSVGVVVSEMRIRDGEEQRLDSKTLQYLKDEALTLEVGDELATLAVDEGDKYHDDEGNLIECAEKVDNKKDSDEIDNESGVDTNSVKSVDRNECDQNGGGIGNGEKFICYMCYEQHDTPEDPLVAPCECRGDTRYLHVQCLQKWYQSSVCGPQSQVIRTTGNGAPACKICGTAYKTAFKRADGKRANLLELESSRPYLSLVVVTRHDTNASLFNTKFRLNFGRLSDQQPDTADNPNELIIGRSSSCNMVLDYRTVSTIHAKITYENGSFYLQDKKSSNGTMMYLQEPFPLSFAYPCRLRMGRTTLTLQPKRSMTASMREMFRRNSNTEDSNGSYLTPQQFQNLMAGASIITSGGNTSALLALNTNLSRPGSSAEVVAALSTGGYYLSPYCVFVIGVSTGGPIRNSSSASGTGTSAPNADNKRGSFSYESLRVADNSDSPKQEARKSAKTAENIHQTMLRQDAPLTEDVITLAAGGATSSRKSLPQQRLFEYLAASELRADTSVTSKEAVAPDAQYFP